MSTGNMSVGARAIDFTLPEADGGQNVTLSELVKKQNVVLMFYRGLF